MNDWSTDTSHERLRVLNIQSGYLYYSTIFAGGNSNNNQLQGHDFKNKLITTPILNRTINQIGSVETPQKRTYLTFLRFLKFSRFLLCIEFKIFIFFALSLSAPDNFSWPGVLYSLFFTRRSICGNFQNHRF